MPSAAARRCSQSRSRTIRAELRRLPRPSGAFVDHQQHDVGSGGLFKTPTLRNADFNAPYFHDGRFDTYDQVVAHFDTRVRSRSVGAGPEGPRRLSDRGRRRHAAL